MANNNVVGSLIALLIGVSVWKMIMASTLIVSKIRNASEEDGITVWLAATYMAAAINSVWMAAIIAGLGVHLAAWAHPFMELLIGVGIIIQILMAIFISLLMWALHSDKIKQLFK